MPIHILTLSCPDQPGIIAGITRGLFDLGANIVENAQFTDTATSTFCMRTRFDVDEFDPNRIIAGLSGQAQQFRAHLAVRREDQRPRVLMMVSRYDHCLLDLLYRRRTGELQADFPLVVSNHIDLRDTVLRNDVAFEHVPVTADTKADAEGRLLELIDQHRVDLVVLARYMQILSEDLCNKLPGRIINIHHSFLPGFKGAKPYHQAYDRGVKLIGATAHYVTANLDEGPIIDQDVVRVSHADTPEKMVAKGRDVERQVLSRAVRAHTDERVFLLDHRTVVLD